MMEQPWPHGGSSPPVAQTVNAQDDPSRMVLSQQEKRLALIIKEAVAQDPELRPLSDFMYAHFAVVSLIDPVEMEDILEQIRQLQYVKEEYEIIDTYAHGKQTMDQYVQDLVPGHLLDFGFAGQAYYQVRDITTFDAANVIPNDDKTRVWIAAEYYVKQASYPDFEAIRLGLVALNECQGYDWASNVMLNIKAIRKLSSELGACYPLHYRAIKYYHTNTFFNIAMSSVRSLLPSLIHQLFEFGCQLEEDTDSLRDLFLVPNLESVNNRLLAALDKTLRRRYDHESSFSLE